MKCSLGISNFLEEISSLSCCIFFPLFLCIIHLGRLSYLSLLFLGTLHSDAYIFPFLLCFSLSCIGEENGNLLQYSCLENPTRDGGASWAAVYGVAQSWTWLKWLSSSSSTLWLELGQYPRYAQCSSLNKMTLAPFSWPWDQDLIPSLLFTL